MNEKALTSNFASESGRNLSRARQKATDTVTPAGPLNVSIEASEAVSVTLLPTEFDMFEDCTRCACGAAVRFAAECDAVRGARFARGVVIRSSQFAECLESLKLSRRLSMTESTHRDWISAHCPRAQETFMLHFSPSLPDRSTRCLRPDRTLLSIVVSFTLLAAACGGSSADSTTIDDSSSDITIAVSGAPSGLSGPITLAAERRLGTGRAVAAASNGIQTVVATTAELAVRSEAGGAFRSIAAVTDAVRDVAISTDGSRVAVVTNDAGLTIWSVSDEPMPIVVMGGVAGAEFRSDGSLAIVGADGLRIVDAVDGTMIDEWIVPGDRTVGPFALADDGHILLALAGGLAPEILRWSGQGQSDTTALRIGGVMSIARIVTAGDRVALGLLNDSGGFDGRISVFETGFDESLWDLDLGAEFGGASWSLGVDGTLAVGESSTVRVVDATGREVASITTAAPVTSIAAGGLVGLANGAVIRIDGAGEPTEILDGLAPLTDFHVDRNTGSATYIDAAGRVGIIDDGALSVVLNEEFVAASINDVAVAPDGRVATASANGVVEVTETGSTAGAADVTRLVHDEGNVDSVAFSADGTQIATGIAERRAETAWDDTVSLWTAGELERAFEIGGEAEGVAGCAFFTNRLRFARNGSFVVSTSHDFTVDVIAIPSGELLHTFPPHANSVLDVAISPDDSMLVTSGDDSTMRVWDLATYELIADHPITMGGFWSMSFLPDGGSIIAGDLSGNVSIVDVASGATTATFDGTKARQARTAVSPNGGLVAAGAEGSIVRLWSTATGQVVGEADGHTAAVSSVEFFDDGERLVSASRDGTAMIWQLSS